MAESLIKFRRGTQAAYDRLLQLNRVDEDTLYFIYNPNAKTQTGRLYLGTTPIDGLNEIAGGIITFERNDSEKELDVSEYLNDKFEELGKEPAIDDVAIVDGQLYFYDGSDWITLREYISEITGKIYWEEIESI